MRRWNGYKPQEYFTRKLETWPHLPNVISLTIMALIFIGTGIGIALAALSHPWVYSLLFGGEVKSLDHEESNGPF